MNAQRRATAVKLINIGTGFHQQTRNLYSRLRSILLARRDIEKRLLTISAGTGRHLNADAALKRLAHPFDIALADEVKQRNLAYFILHPLGKRSRLRLSNTHTMLLQMRPKIFLVPLPAKMPVPHSGLQISVTEFKQEHAHLVVAILVPHLAERHGRHHAVALPGRHGGIWISALLQQNTGHAHTGRSCARVHEAHQQAQRRITHIAQLLPVTSAGIHRNSGIQQCPEQVLIRIHTGSMQRRETTGRHLTGLTRMHDFVKQFRHLALPAPLPTVNTGVLLHHLVRIVVRVI